MRDFIVVPFEEWHFDVIELDELLTKNEKHRNAYRLANERETRKQRLKFS